MKITFVTPGWGLSGGDRVIAIYAERLRKRGHDVLLVAPGKRSPGPWRRFKDLLKGKGWGTEHDEATHLSNDVPRVRLDRPRPVTDQDVPDADVVVATWWETAEWVAKLSPQKGAKVSFIQHYEVFFDAPKARVDAVWRLPLHKITISKWLVDLAREEFGDDKVSLVFNSVDTAQFHAPPRGKEPVPTIGMLYSPNIGWKGTDVCLDALKKMTVKPSRVVAFSGSVRDPGVPPHPSLPPGSSFHYRPAQDHIKDIYAECDVWLCGSRGEGFHLPPLEAMACRCPVVSTAVGGPSDIVKDGVNGYVVPIEDSTALAERLDRVLSLADEAWRAMSDAAYATATRYTWDNATELFEQGLQEAIARRSRGEIA
jgi:glycosyltransferase involved in cell wall biosynthesis